MASATDTLTAVAGPLVEVDDEGDALELQPAARSPARTAAPSTYDDLNTDTLTAIRIDARHLKDFNFKKIREEILSVPTNQFVSSFIKVNKNWDGIALVGPNGLHTWNLGMGGNFLDTPVLDALPCTQAFLHALPLELQSVRISCLGPQGKIMPHRDFDLYGGLLRLHLVLTTNDGVNFRIGQHRIPMREGELWYGNFNLNHSVENGGSEERIHLLIDGYALKDTANLFRSGTENFDKFLSSAYVSSYSAGNDLIGKQIKMTLNDATRRRSMYCCIERTKNGLGLKLSGTPIFVADLFPYCSDGFVVNGTPFKFSVDDDNEKHASIDIDSTRITQLKKLISVRSDNNGGDEARDDAVTLQFINPSRTETLISTCKQYLMYIYLTQLSVFLDLRRKQGFYKALRSVLSAR